MSTPKQDKYYLSRSPKTFVSDQVTKKYETKSASRLEKISDLNLISAKFHSKKVLSSKKFLKPLNLTDKNMSLNTSKKQNYEELKSFDNLEPENPKEEEDKSSKKKLTAIEIPGYLASQSEYNDSEGTYARVSEKSFSRMTDQKVLIERSQQLATKRKKEHDESPLKKSLRNLSPANQKQKQVFQPSRTLTKFIDRMILKGSLPLEATEYFSPYPRLTPKNHVKLQPVQKKIEREMFSCLKFSDNLGHQSMNESIIPDWMANLSDFHEKYKTTKMAPKFPILDILNKDPDLRDELEVTFLIKWLGKLDLFMRFPFDTLIEISKKLKTVYLKEGQILCNVGEPADCLYIIYEGEIDILLPEKAGDVLAVKSYTGELLGRQNLDKSGKRAAKLRAAKPSHVIVLYRDDYQEVAGDITNTIKPAQEIYDFIMNHSFLQQFSEAKRKALINNLEFRKYYKNDLLFNIGDKSERVFFLMKGIVTRQMAITREKANKWPTSMKQWEMFKKITTYSIKLPIEEGSLFGVKDFIEEKPRSEKVVVETDTLILRCPRQLFNESKLLCKRVTLIFCFSV